MERWTVEASLCQEGRGWRSGQCARWRLARCCFAPRRHRHSRRQLNHRQAHGQTRLYQLSLVIRQTSGALTPEPPELRRYTQIEGEDKMKRGKICALLLCAALSLCVGARPAPPSLAAPSDESYVFLQSWGNEIGLFDVPTSIAVGGGRVYVCDRNNSLIQVFDVHGRPLAIFGESGDGDGQFSLPEGIAVDGSGNVYVADTGNDRIQKFTADGTYLTQWGGAGSGDGQFNYPEGIAVDGSGNVYVADRNNHRIQKFTADGTYLTQWGSERSADGQSHYPGGMAVDASGNVYVADRGNDRIQEFTADGAYLAQGGSAGRGGGEF